MRKFSIIVLAVIMALGLCSVAMADIGYHGNLGATGGDCAACHDNSPTALLRGWAMTAEPSGGNTWYTMPIAKLCWTCHRAGSPYVAYGCTNMDAYAFDNASHGFDVGTVADPARWNGGAIELYTASPGAGDLPYTDGDGTDIDCTTCHNVHNAALRPFAMKGASATDFDALCTLCHIGRVNNTGEAGVGSGNSFNAGGNAYSTHPTDLAISNLTNNGPTGFGTIATQMSIAFPGSNWTLGGHREDGTATGNMSCQTCHTVHGYDDGAVVYGHFEDQLAYANVGTRPSNLCKGCHTGGDPGETVGGGALTDHPVDSITGRLFYPDWNGFPATGIPGDWVGDGAHGEGTGATGFANTQTPVCSSCHDAHGGRDGTSLLYGPIPPAAGGEWCFSCHAAWSILPLYHHSVLGNWATSQLACGDCHGSNGGTADHQIWAAHNGFWGFRNDVTNEGDGISDTNSDFCEVCHVDTNPTAFVAACMDGTNPFTSSGADFPAHHGPADLATLGNGSHAVDSMNINVQNVARSATFDWVGFGIYDLNNADHPAGVLSEWGGGNFILCESCHNILENAGNLTTGGTIQGGWQANLLLAPYEDDDHNTTTGAVTTNQYITAGNPGDAFCRVCHTSGGGTPTAAIDNADYVHYPAAHTVRGFTYSTTPYGRTNATTMTATGTCPESTTADDLSAPACYSYPAANTLDCDSCHRAHNAVNDANGGETGLVIVQYDSGFTTLWTGGEIKTGPCRRCHDVNTMCGY